MRFSLCRFGVLAALTASLAHSGTAHAISCEQLRSSVEAKIQRKGVKNFSVVVVEASVAPSGQVVGTCELGSKKLVYSQSGNQSSASQPVQAAPPRPPGSAPKAGVITECADGRVVTQGSCKR